MDRRTFGTQTEDEGIEWKIPGNLMNKYGEKVHVNQTSYNRKVLLTGEVPDEKTKEDIERMVRGISGVQDVWNELQIGPPSTFQNRSNDAYITSKVKGRFVDGGKFRANLVKVVTEAGDRASARDGDAPLADSAIEIARTTAGVKSRQCDGDHHAGEGKITRRAATGLGQHAATGTGPVATASPQLRRQWPA